MDFDLTFRAASGRFTTWEESTPAPYVRGSFRLCGAKNVTVTVTGLGFYDLFINGKRLTKGICAPYISNPDKEIFFDRYDISKDVTDGENVIGLILGNGFFNAWDGFVWDFDKAGYRGAPMTAFVIEADGKPVFSSADRLTVHDSPVLCDGLREGETYDATREISGWNEPDFDDSGWKEALFVNPPVGRRELCTAEPIAERSRLKAVNVFKTPKGTVFDFGVNTAGVPILKIDGKRGQKITLIVGEKIENGELTTRNISCSARRAVTDKDIQVITYVCRGEKDETYYPTFSYYGGRYVRIEGAEESQLTPETVKFSEQNSEIKVIGSFSCSDELANRTVENTIRSDLSNFYYFPTDCPHREKNGWTGDAYASAEQFAFLLDAERSLSTWLECIRDMQSDSGAIPCVVPTAGWGYGWGSGPSWDGALVAVPYMLYRYGADKKILADNADAIYKYLGFLSSLADDRGLIDYGLGDWCQIGAPCESDPFTPFVYTDTLSAMDICRKAESVFSVLGQSDRATRAKTLYSRFRAAFRDNLIDWKFNGKQPLCRVKCRTQTAQAMAIECGVFDRAEVPVAAYKLAELVWGVDDVMQTGILGTPALLRALFDHGFGDLAYKIAFSPDRPSFGNMVKHGATTNWEFIHVFESDESDEPKIGIIKSMNHHFFGDIAAVLATRVAGLRVNENLADQSEINVAPCFVKSLTCAKTSTETKFGKAEIEWRREGDSVRLIVTLPVGTHGSVVAPDGYAFSGNARLNEGKTEIMFTRVKKNA